MVLYTVSQKKTSPTFLVITRESIDRFLPRYMENRHGLAMRILFVRLSVTRFDCDKTVERSVQIYIPYERTVSLVF